MISDVFRQQVLGEPVAWKPIEPGHELVNLYNIYLRGRRAAASRTHSGPLEVERHAISQTIMYGVRECFQVSELFLRDMYKAIDYFLYKVGHHRQHDLIKLVSDHERTVVHRARLIFGNSQPRFRAEIKLVYDHGPDWIGMVVPVLKEGEKGD